MSYQKIIYQTGSKFKITPDLNTEATIEFNTHIDKLKIASELDTGIPNAFFWKCHQSTLTTDNTITTITINFKDQLIKIADWLFDHGFALEGSFCFRTADSVETIEMIPQHRMIKHYVLVEKINSSDTEEKILINGQNKIYSQINQIESPRISINITCGNNYFTNPIPNTDNSWTKYILIASGFLTGCAYWAYKVFLT